MTIDEYIELTKATGGFVCGSEAALLADVSTQRIYDLMKEGRLPTVVVFGQRFLKLPELRAWILSPRKAGRPRGTKSVAGYDQAKTSGVKEGDLRRVSVAAMPPGGDSALFERLKELRRQARSVR